MVAQAPNPLPASIEDQLLEAIISGTLPSAPRTQDQGPRTSTSPITSSPAHLLTSTSPTPLQLARHFHLSLPRLLDFLSSPTTRARIVAAQDLADLAEHQRAQRAREKALASLETILDTTDDPVEKRRAASAILRRHSSRRPHFAQTVGGPGAAGGPNNAQRPMHTALFPPPEHCFFTDPPQGNLLRVLTRLHDNDNPSRDSGLATLFNFKLETGALTGKGYDQALADYLETPGPDADLINFSAAILDPPLKPTDRDHFTQPVALHWPDNTVRRLLFHLTADPSPRCEQIKAWRIAAIEDAPDAKPPGANQPDHPASLPIPLGRPEPPSSAAQHYPQIHRPVRLKSPMPTPSTNTS